MSLNPSISIIIPVYNSERTLDQCISSIYDSTFNDFEIILVDDCSTDTSVSVMKNYNCQIIELKHNQGANNARNIGALNAKGNILVFIDSDVMVKENTLERISRKMKNEYIGAVVGIYAWEYRNENLISQYKNLWIRYSYLKSSAQIDWIFGAISSIRKDLFLKIGGFDLKLIARHGNDDIEFGKRISKAGYKILLDPKIEAFHLKQFNLYSLIKNEFNRSFGFAKLAVNLNETSTSIKNGFVNIYPSFIIGTIIAIVLPILFLMVFLKLIPNWVLYIIIGLFFLNNIRFLNFFEQVRGFFTMIIIIPVLFLDQFTCFIGAVFGTLSGIKNKLFKR